MKINWKNRFFSCYLNFYCLCEIFKKNMQTIRCLFKKKTCVVQIKNQFLSRFSKIFFISINPQEEDLNNNIHFKKKFHWQHPSSYLCLLVFHWLLRSGSACHCIFFHLWQPLQLLESCFCSALLLYSCAQTDNYLPLTSISCSACKKRK